MAGILITACQVSNPDRYIVDVKASAYPVPYRVAIYRDVENSDPYTVLYYFHGSESDESSWGKSYGEIINRWRETERPIPVVISISFGSRWIMTPSVASRPQSGLLDIFLADIMPRVEETSGIHAPRRLIMGFSMGGANAAELFFRHPNLFQKAVILSPFVYDFDVTDEKAVKIFIDQERNRLMNPKTWLKTMLTGKDPVRDGIVDRITNIRAAYFPDQESWRSYDIMRNMRAVSDALPVYIACGKADPLGFFPASKNLAEQASRHGYAVTWRANPGGHRIMRQEEIADYLLD